MTDSSKQETSHENVKDTKTYSLMIEICDDTSVTLPFKTIAGNQDKYRQIHNECSVLATTKHITDIRMGKDTFSPYSCGTVSCKKYPPAHRNKHIS